MKFDLAWLKKNSKKFIDQLYFDDQKDAVRKSLFTQCHTKFYSKDIGDIYVYIELPREVPTVCSKWTNWSDRSDNPVSVAFDFVFNSETRKHELRQLEIMDHRNS